MKLFKHKKSNLDEWQEQKLLHIEKKSFWILYWMLVAEMVLHIALGGDMRGLLGEWLCFMGVSIYMVSACLKNGIWDRRLKADRKTNFKVSLAASAAIFVIMGLIYQKISAADSVIELFLMTAGTTLLMFVITFTVLCLLAAGHRRQLQKLETAEEEE